MFWHVLVISHLIWTDERGYKKQLISTTHEPNHNGSPKSKRPQNCRNELLREQIQKRINKANTSLTEVADMAMCVQSRVMEDNYRGHYWCVPCVARPWGSGQGHYQALQWLHHDIWHTVNTYVNTSLALLLNCFLE